MENEGKPSTTEQPVTPQKSVREILKKDPLYEKAVEIVYWRDPIASGLLFGIINLFFLLITYGEYSVVTLVSYFFETLIIAAFGYTMYLTLIPRLQNKPIDPPLREKVKDPRFNVSAEDFQRHSDVLADLVNLFLDNLKEAVVCVDLFVTFRAAAVFYLFATLGDWFSGITLLYLASLVLFVWPRLYHEKQQEIDKAVALAVDLANTYYEKGRAMLPPQVKDRLPATLFPKVKND